MTPRRHTAPGGQHRRLCIPRTLKPGERGRVGGVCGCLVELVSLQLEVWKRVQAIVAERPSHTLWNLGVRWAFPNRGVFLMNDGAEPTTLNQRLSPVGSHLLWKDKLRSRNSGT